MNKMNPLIIVIILLSLICLMLFLRLFQYKCQLKRFTTELRKRRSREVMSPIEVDLFNREIVELAVALNEYTDEQKELTLQMEKDREKLNYVIAGISHDFRTPLTASCGYMQMVKKSGELSEKSLEYLRIALEKTQYLKELSDDFFEMSTMEAKLKQIKQEKIHLNKLLEECILGQYDWVEKAGLEAEFKVPDWSVYVWGNEYYLKRVVENLFSNFRKYAKSRLKVSVEVMGENVRLIAENDVESITGELSKESAKELFKDKIFEPFYRGDARDKEGSGLGLYVVKCLAVAMGYEVWSEQEEGKFRIVLQIPVEKREKV